jgi:hypothetical protein
MRWKDDPMGPYVRLKSGTKFHLTNPRASDIHVSDVAYHLSGINRFTGGSRYSVAQHCVVAAEMARQWYSTGGAATHHLLPARMLIHDAAEYAYGDVSSPLKSLCPDYAALIHAMDAVVERRFDCLFLDDPRVKEIDDRMWLTERLHVYDEPFAEDINDVDLAPFPPVARWFTPWSPREAEEEWLMALRRELPWVS